MLRTSLGFFFGIRAARNVRAADADEKANEALRALRAMIFQENLRARDELNLTICERKRTIGETRRDVAVREKVARFARGLERLTCPS